MLRLGRAVSYCRRLGVAWLAASVGLPIVSGNLSGQTLDQPILLEGHHGPVMMGAFAPGGDLVATAGADHSLRVWDVATAKEIRAFELHTGPVYCLAIDGAGRTLVSGSQDNTVRTWDLPQTKPLLELKTGETALRAFAVGPDGASTGCIDEAGQIWFVEVPTGAPVGAALTARPLGKHAAPGTDVAFRSDGAFFAASDAAGRVSIWSPYLDGQQADFLAHEAAVTAVRYRPNDARLVTAGADGALRIWQAGPVPSKSVASGYPAIVDGAPILVRAEYAIGAADGSLRIVDAATGAAVRDLPKQDAPIASIAVAPNGSWLVAATETGILRAYDATAGVERGLLLGHAGIVRDVAVHPDSARFATAGEDGAVRLWTLPAAWPTTIEAKGHTGPIRGFGVAPSLGDWFATVGDDLTTRQWNAAGSPVRQVGLSAAALRAIGVRFDGTAFATGDAAGEVRVWGAASGALEGIVATADGETVAVALSGDGSTLITVGANGAVRGWKLPLPVEKPKDGEVPPAPIWSQGPVAGSPRHAIGLPGDRGFLVVSPDRKSIQRLKTDGASLGDLAGPGGAIVALAISRDAERLVAVDDAGAARIWNSSGEATANLAVGKGVVGISFSPDAKEFALADGSDRVRIVDAAATSGEALARETLLAPFAVSHVGFLGGDAMQFAVAGPGADAAVLKRSLARFWNVGPRAARKLAFSGDQQFLYASAADGAVRQYRLSDGELVRTFEGGDESGAFALSPDGQRLAAPGPDGKLHQRQTADGVETIAIALPSKVAELAFSTDGQRVAVASDDGFLRLYDLATGSLLQSYAGTVASLRSVAFLSDNATLVAATADGAVRLEKPSALRALTPHVGPIRGMALLNGGGQAATSGEDGRVILTDLENRTELRTFDVEGAKPTSVAVRNDNQRLAAGTETGKVYVWNPNDATRLATFDVGAAVVGLAWSSDNQKLAVADAAKKVTVFGPSLPGQAQQELVLHQTFDAKSAIAEIAFGAGSRDLWTALEAGRLADWSYASPTPIRQFNHGGAVYGVAVGRDGKTIVSCSADQTVRVWDAVTGQQRFQLNGHEGPVLAVALGKDETFAVSSGADGTLRLWDVVGGRQLKQLAKFDSTMYSVAIHPNGTVVAAAGADRKVHLLDVLAGTETATFAGHEDYVHGVAWRPDGARLLSYGYAGAVKLWSPPTPTPILDGRVGRIGNFAAWNDAGSLVLLSNGDGIARIVAVTQ